MNHIILDKSVVYSDRFRNYYFKFSNGYRSDYFRLHDGVKVDSNGLLIKNTFNVFRSNKTGYYSISNKPDTSQRCLVFLNVEAATEYETLQLVDDESICKIIEVYNTYNASGYDELKIIVILSPSKPLFVKRVSKKSSKYDFYEVYLYDSIHEKVLHKTLNRKEFDGVKESVQLTDSDFNCKKFKVNKKMLNSLSDKDIKEATEYYNRYYSYQKDQHVSDMTTDRTFPDI